MEHVTSLLRDIAPWALTFTVGVLAKIVHGAKRSFDSLKETKFKADEAHEELCLREPEFARRYKTWAAHQ